MAELNNPLQTGSLKGWKTLGVAVGLGALGGLQVYLQSTGGGGIPLPWVGPALIAISAVMAGLRAYTDTPMGAAEPPK